MASYNRVILVGNLTRDPELKYIPSGTAVTEIGLAVNDRRKNASGEWVEETTFVDVTLWARTAEIASEYLSKGSNVLIEGRLKLDTWEKEGKKHSKLRVVGDRMQMLGARGGGGGPGGGRGGPGKEEAPHGAARDEMEAPPHDDDIPF
jgi:single-strand DNA-binding protein